MNIFQEVFLERNRLLVFIWIFYYNLALVTIINFLFTSRLFKAIDKNLMIFFSKLNTWSQEINFTAGVYTLILLLLIYLLEESRRMEIFLTSFDKPGNLIYSTKWRNSTTKVEEDVFLHQHCICTCNMFLPYTFDLRFIAREHTITLILKDKEVFFELVQGNQKALTEILKHYINQGNFHEKFKPIKKIGKGNFASVYLAENLETGEHLAVKAFSKEQAYSETNGRQCLLKEIQIMRALNSPYNMKLVEVFQSDNSLYIVFELLSGGQLFQKIKAKQVFKPHQVQLIIRTILEGLIEMHQKRIMHRDLKPENILLRAQGSFQCVIADYGLAQFADSEQYLYTRCGTPGYVAPQVINIKDMKVKYDPICDMFSLGLIFHLLLFGKSIFKGRTYNEVLNENRACNLNLNGPEYEKADKDAMNLMKKMLINDPKERITAKQAIQHSYFSFSLQEKKEQLSESLDKVPMIGESPILTTGNEIRKQNKQLMRDSCLTFKMGNDNALTGKTETVDSFGPSKVSAFGLGLLKSLKPSKFTKAPPKQNI